MNQVANIAHLPVTAQLIVFAIGQIFCRGRAYPGFNTVRDKKKALTRIFVSAFLWSHQGLNLGPPDYESGATNQLSYFRILPEWDCKGTKFFYIQKNRIFYKKTATAPLGFRYQRPDSFKTARSLLVPMRKGGPQRESPLDTYIWV